MDMRQGAVIMMNFKVKRGCDAFVLREEVDL